MVQLWRFTPLLDQEIKTLWFSSPYFWPTVFGYSKIESSLEMIDLALILNLPKSLLTSETISINSPLRILEDIIFQWSHYMFLLVFFWWGCTTKSVWRRGGLIKLPKNKSIQYKIAIGPGTNTKLELIAAWTLLKAWNVATSTLRITTRSGTWKPFLFCLK